MKKKITAFTCCFLSINQFTLSMQYTRYIPSLIASTASYYMQGKGKAIAVTVPTGVMLAGYLAHRRGIDWREMPQAAWNALQNSWSCVQHTIGWQRGSTNEPVKFKPPPEEVAFIYP